MEPYKVRAQKDPPLLFQHALARPHARLGLSDNDCADLIVHQETQSARPSGARMPPSRAPLDRCIKSEPEAFWIGYLRVPNCAK
jgi:hypothetical protein